MQQTIVFACSVDGGGISEGCSITHYLYKFNDVVLCYHYQKKILFLYQRWH